MQSLIPWYLLKYVIPIPLEFQLAMFIIMVVVFIPLTIYLINKKVIDKKIIGIAKGKSITYSVFIGWINISAVDPDFYDPVFTDDIPILEIKHDVKPTTDRIRITARQGFEISLPRKPKCWGWLPFFSVVVSFYLDFLYSDGTGFFSPTTYVHKCTLDNLYKKDILVNSVEIEPSIATRHILIKPTSGLHCIFSEFFPYKSSPDIYIKIDINWSIEADAHGPYSGIVDIPVNFTASAIGGVTSAYEYSWDFGDGSTSPLQKPSYTYNAPGKYNVTLTVKDTVCGGEDIDVTYAQITES